MSDMVYFVEYRNRGVGEWLPNGTLFNHRHDALDSMQRLIEQDQMFRRSGLDARVSEMERPPGFTGVPSDKQLGQQETDSD